jgi:hypothetical protein
MPSDAVVRAGHSMSIAIEHVEKCKMELRAFAEFVRSRPICLRNLISWIGDDEVLMRTVITAERAEKLPTDRPWWVF